MFRIHTIVRALEYLVQIPPKRTLVGIFACFGFLVDDFVVGVEVVWRLDLLGVVGWRILEVADGGLPVEIRTN